MKKVLLLSTSLLAALAASSQVYLADTAFTTNTNSGGAPASSISKPNGNNYGMNMNHSAGFYVADDFTVPSGQTWSLDTVIVYGYQTNSTTTSTFTGASLQIRQGSVTGSALFGDTTTNRLVASGFTGIYRVDTTSGGVNGTSRPIMYLKLKVTPTLNLSAGNYWLIWSATGSLASGPWCPPKVLPGLVNPGGQNGMQLSNGNWIPAQDSLSPTAVQTLGFNFMLKGPNASGLEQLSAMDAGLQLAPNPVNDRGTISFTLSRTTNVSVLIYNAAGQLVTTPLQNSPMTAGTHQLPLSTAALPAGAYFYQVQTDYGRDMKKMQVQH